MFGVGAAAGPRRRNIPITMMEEQGMNRDQIKGRTQEAKGKIKEVAGKITGDKTLEIRGTAEKTGGKIQAGYGDLKRDIKKGG